MGRKRSVAETKERGMSDFADPIPEDEPPEIGEQVAEMAEELEAAEDETDAAEERAEGADGGARSDPV
jgi:hypothetical protein